MRIAGKAQREALTVVWQSAIRRSGLSLACALPCLRQVDPCSRQGLFPAFLGRELAREISDYSHFRGRVEPHFVTKTINSCLARNIRESSSETCRRPTGCSGQNLACK